MKISAEVMRARWPDTMRKPMDNNDRKSFTEKSLRDDENIKALIVTLANTSASLEHGEKIYASLGRTVRRLRTMLWISVIGLVSVLALLVSFMFVLNQQSQLTHKIQANSDRITKVSCDLNTIFLQANTLERYNAADNKKLYTQWYHAIYQNRIELNCQPPMSEPVRNP
jgi:hypothetical protein